MTNEKTGPTFGKGEVIAIKGSYKQPFQVRVGDKVVAQCLGDQLEPDAASIGEARKNAELIAAAFTAAHEVAEMGYDPAAAMEELSTLLRYLALVQHGIQSGHIPEQSLTLSEDDSAPNANVYALSDLIGSALARAAGKEDDHE